jgi:hypothetical protein
MPKDRDHENGEASRRQNHAYLLGFYLEVAHEAMILPDLDIPELRNVVKVLVRAPRAIAAQGCG